MNNQKTKILILDDDKAITEALAIALSVYGFEVKGITNYSKLISTALSFKPDLVLLDYFLAGEDGTKVAAQLRAKKGMEQTKIIMISAHPSAKNEIDMSQINAFVPKPFDINDLVTKINSMVA